MIYHVISISRYHIIYTYCKTKVPELASLIDKTKGDTAQVQKPP